MEKQFECYALIGSENIHGAVGVAFGVSIGDELMTARKAEARFDALEIGETLVDEDGDTWERIA